MEQVIVDPGIGFGKSVEDNFTILRRLAEFRSLGQPLLVGPSRKSFIGAALNLPAQERLNTETQRFGTGHKEDPPCLGGDSVTLCSNRRFGTVAASVLAVANGANILRVHDVEAVKQAVAVAERVLGGRGAGR
jgi:dihydropteroate synthase